VRRRAQVGQNERHFLMLYYKPNGSNASGARTISGASLARFLRHMSAPQRAVLAAEILNGRIILTDLTAKAVAALVDVNQSYVNAALRCTPEQRLAVASGKRPLVRRARERRRRRWTGGGSTIACSRRQSAAAIWIVRCRSQSKSKNRTHTRSWRRRRECRRFLRHDWRKRQCKTKHYLKLLHSN
jgi:hypothetical protein